MCWGALTGWSQTGNLFCATHCPGGCGGASGCVPPLYFGSELTGLPPLASNSFNTDPWVFTGDSNQFRAAPFQHVNLAGGNVTSTLQLGGRLLQVPAMPLAPLAVLAGALAYLGGHAYAARRRASR